MKKILEIGGGRTPYVVRYKIPWNPEDYYIAVDIHQENLEMSREAFKTYIKENNICPLDPLLTIDDALNLNIPSNSIDEIIISNTISAPIHYDWDRDGNTFQTNNKDKNFTRQIKSESDSEDPFYIERKNLLKESLRVLKNGGMLSIYTDLIIYGAHSYNRILKELKNDNRLNYFFDQDEALRIDDININKLKGKEFCCCFRAEVLPNSEVHRFVKI